MFRSFFSLFFCLHMHFPIFHSEVFSFTIFCAKFFFRKYVGETIPWGKIVSVLFITFIVFFFIFPFVELHSKQIFVFFSFRFHFLFFIKDILNRKKNWIENIVFLFFLYISWEKRNKRDFCCRRKTTSRSDWIRIEFTNVHRYT